MIKSPYLSLSELLLDRYGAKTYKLTLSGGQTCPTRDGSLGPQKGWGGCSFCDVYGSASYHTENRKHLSIQEQLEEATKGIKKRFKAEKFIAYFQSYTTTYKEISEFHERCKVAIDYPNVVAISVATRPDCLSESFLELLSSYAEKVDIILELGVQSFHDPTLEWYTRGHDSNCSIKAIQWSKEVALKTKKDKKNRYFDIVPHIIIGSPLELDKDLIESARLMNKLKVDGVKIHHLHILKKTKLAIKLKKDPFPLLSLKEYGKKVLLYLRNLEPTIAIHRIHATASRGEDLLGPSWSNMRAYPSQYLKELMQKENYYQGDLL